MISLGDIDHTTNAILRELGANATYVSQQNTWLAANPLMTPRDYLAARVRPAKPLPEFTNYAAFAAFVIALPTPSNGSY